MRSFFGGASSIFTLKNYTALLDIPELIYRTFPPFAQAEIHFFYNFLRFALLLIPRTWCAVTSLSTSQPTLRLLLQPPQLPERPQPRIPTRLRLTDETWIHSSTSTERSQDQPRRQARMPMGRSRPTRRLSPFPQLSFTNRLNSSSGSTPTSPTHPCGSSFSSSHSIFSSHPTAPSQPAAAERFLCEDRKEELASRHQSHRWSADGVIVRGAERFITSELRSKRRRRSSSQSSSSETELNIKLSSIGLSFTFSKRSYSDLLSLPITDTFAVFLRLEMSCCTQESTRTSESVSRSFSSRPLLKAFTTRPTPSSRAPPSPSHSFYEISSKCKLSSNPPCPSTRPHPLDSFILHAE